jgi:hypothetical protein
MRLSRAIPAAIIGVVALIGSTLTGAVAAPAPQGEKPPAADVGISDTEIRLAVIADVDTPVVPGLFRAAVDTMRAWAKVVNKQGGVADRKVVIDFIDSKLSPNDARDGTIKACSEDFAMVGGEALFLNNVDDMVGCPNAQGQPVGLPDMPGLALDPAQQCSPVTYVYVGGAEFCATRGQNPATYETQVGDARFYLKKKKDLHGAFILPSDIQSAKNSQQAAFEGAVELGIKRDGEGFYNISAMSPQSALTPVVQALKNNNSTFAYNGQSPGIMVLLRREAKVQGANSVEIWACNQGCYDQEFLKQGGADVDGTYTVLTTLPFYTEYKSNKTLNAVVKELGGVSKMTANSAASLVGALMFQEAAEKAVANGGTLSRQSLLDALKTMTSFDAQGIIGPTDIANKKSPPCIVMAQVKDGKWVRAHPSKAGKFDCSEKNLMNVQVDVG